MKTLIENYGMVFVLIALCILFSILTIKEQNPDSDSAANQIVKKIQQSYAQNSHQMVIILPLLVSIKIYSFGIFTTPVIISPF